MLIVSTPYTHSYLHNLLPLLVLPVDDSSGGNGSSSGWLITTTPPLLSNHDPISSHIMEDS